MAEPALQHAAPSPGEASAPRSATPAGPPAGPPVRRRLPWRRIGLVLGGMALVFVVACVAFAVVVLRETPSFDSIRDYRPPAATKVVAADGSVVGEFFKERRTVVSLDRVPRVLIHAIVSAEDKDFYNHPGFSFTGLLRAAIVDALSGRARLGASTITQQVVKNFFLTSEKRLKRKGKELLLATRLERNLSKDDILFLYLNQINFGRARYGVEEASLYYFGKHVQDIDLGEAALLAGLPQNPAKLNPRRHPERAKRRQVYVLDRMLDNGYIGREEHDREVRRELALPLLPPEPPGGWYLEEVRRQLIAKLGEAAVDTGGLTVQIAMDPALQAAAEASVQDGLRAVDRRQGYRGPLFRVPAARMEELRAALRKRLALVPPSATDALAVDLAGSASAPAGAAPATFDPEAAASAVQVRALKKDATLAGLVTRVSGAGIHVELGPGIEGTIPFSTLAWARPFAPEHATPAPRSAADVAKVGDVVRVRVVSLRTTHDAPHHVQVVALDLALDQAPLVQGAFVGLDLRTRNVLALVGGYEYDASHSSFNRATQAHRQPGSSFKPFLFAAALESGKFTPATRMDDSPEVIVDPWSHRAWKPQNFEKDEFAGPLSLRRALAESKNTIAVKLLLNLGLERVTALAKAAGLSSDIPQNTTAALGTGEVFPLEMVNAYATIASGGLRGTPILVRKVLSRDGSTLLETQPALQQAWRPETAYLTADLMRSVIDDPEGSGRSLALDRAAAGKTGTTNEHRDGWFIGFTPSLLAGAWVGFDDHKKMGSYEQGAHCAGPIWLSWMRSALADRPREEWPAVPAGISELRINRNTGGQTQENDAFGVREIFLSGTEPAQASQEQPPDRGQFYDDQH